MYDDPDEGHKPNKVDNKVVLYTKSVAGVLTSDFFSSLPCPLEECEIVPEISTQLLLSLDHKVRIHKADDSSNEEHPYLVFSKNLSCIFQGV